RTPFWACVRLGGVGRRTSAVTSATRRTNDVRQRLFGQRDRRLLHGEHRRGDQRGRRPGLKDAAQPRLVRGQPDPRPHRGRPAVPLPGDAEGGLPAGRALVLTAADSTPSFGITAKTSIRNELLLRVS